MAESQSQVLALIIGGISGIGRANAQRFAAEGMRLVVTGRDCARGEAAAISSGGVFQPVDVADRASVEAPSAAMPEAPQILVNHAGILQSGKRVLDQPLDEDERMWRNNYRGTLVGTQVFGRRMQAGGAILNVGSLASFAPLSLPAYMPGKQAVKALTEVLANELGLNGIHDNSLAPGYTLSDGLKAKIAAGERNPEAIVATTALRRFVMREDVAEAALFPCSNRAVSITGVTLPVDAGWLVQAPHAQYLRGDPIKDIQ